MVEQHADRDRDAERLDSEGDVQPILLMMVGSALLLGAAATIVFSPPLVRMWIVGGVMALIGLLLFRSGWRRPRAYAAKEGLLLERRRGSRRVVPWTDVDVIELQENQDDATSDAVSLLRLRLMDGERVTVRCKPSALDKNADTVRAHCPQAFVDDRRSGEILPPTGGDPENVRQREARLVALARRAQAGLAWLWGASAVIGAAATALAARMALDGGQPKLWLVCVGLAAATAFAVHAALARRRLARETGLAPRRA